MLVYIKRTPGCHTCYTASTHGVNWSNPVPNSSKATLSRNQAMIVRRVYRRTLSGMAEYLSLPAGWLNELHPATLLTCCMHLSQPFREFDTDNATIMLQWNTFIKIPLQLRKAYRGILYVTFAEVSRDYLST